MNNNEIAVLANNVPIRTAPSVYPEPFASKIRGREKKQLSKVFGLTNITVNLTRLTPKSVSALRHAHAKQDEFVYILQGNPILHTNKGLTNLSPGMCAGFRAGSGDAHCLINNTEDDVIYLEAGDNTSGDEVSYPDDDLKLIQVEGKWECYHKNGQKYK